MNKDLVAIFEYLEREKGIKREIIVAAIRESLEIAAKKSVFGAENVTVEINSKTGAIDVFCDKIIVEKVVNPVTEITKKEALEIFPGTSLGDVVRVQITPRDFGRVAAQKARQIITQKLKGAERDVVYEEYRHRIQTLVSGTVKRVGRGNCVIVDLGKVEGVLARKHYLPQESFQVGNKVLALLQEVSDTEMGGAEVILSRTNPEFVRQLFLQEVPELMDGTITIEKIVREPGYRTKMIVRTQDQKVDPVGACIGMKGSRVKNIVRELGTEKIDIIPYSQDPEEELNQAISPVVIRKMTVSEDGHTVSLVVDDEDFPTIIGKKGMNVRLLGQLLNVQFDVQRMSDFVKISAIQRAELATSSDETLDQPLSSIEGIPNMVIDQLVAEGFATPRQLLLAAPEDVAKVPGVSIEMAHKILEQIRKQRA